MPSMGLFLTDEQRARLEKLANSEGRSMNNMIARLIDLEWESRLAWKEHNTDNDGAQNPEPETV